MEILFVSHKFPPSVGGMEKQSFELIKGFEKFAVVHSLVYTGSGSRLFFFLSLEKKIDKIIKEFPSISIIHFNDALIASVCLLHKRYRHLRRVVTVHGLDVVFPSKIYQKFIFPALNRYDLIIAVSKATAGACIERGIEPQKVITIPNGVDHALSQAAACGHFTIKFKEQYAIDLSQKTVLIALGRPVKRKGFSWFLENVLPGLNGDFILLMAGPFHRKRPRADIFRSLIPEKISSKIQLLLGYPSDENRLRILLERSETRNKVLHLGKLPQEDLVQILTLSDAFIMPNIKVEGDMEGFGLVCLEASLAGNWVFASDIDGITSAIHDGLNGTLLKPENHEQWIQALNVFIKDPSKFASASASSRIFTQQTFGWHKMVQQYAEQFHSLN
ncbi:glycosyltransferase family 4 protein [Dyadobacter sp. CY356]|uniref:glycosyltransferase family 4 protein n=1 Tax=Dyadobacter sp. CY356 TaxID=2906442 RepID=UPI001F2AA0DC|nr:glycosyltransferase family 4 protein [Dyadobacter sp. CY356]MCF0054510.1 glycosyltransferase family 4 protein [Dyadobacter sp. CY356]